MALTIRRYHPEDREAVRALHFEGLEAVGALAGDPSLDEDLGRIEEAYLATGGEFLVGTIGRNVVAMGALKKVSGAWAEIKRMRVSPRLWRRGHGQEVLSALARRAAGMGYETLRLDTAVHQTSARRLYEKNGFREVGRGSIGGIESVFYEGRVEGIRGVRPDEFRTSKC